MKLFRTSAAVVLLLAGLVSASTGSAQRSGSDPDIALFWSKFKAAVLKSDKTSVAAMSQFPIDMPYGVPKIRTRTQIARRWRDLFVVQADALKCFQEAKPAVDSPGSKVFTVYCKNSAGDEVVVYGFKRGRSGWKLAYLDNINE